jgi:hypothetical protein
MRSNVSKLSAALAALALLACAPARAEPPKGPPAAASGADFRYTKALASGQAVSIRNIMGSVRAEPSASNVAEVLATKVAEPGADPSLVRVVARETPKGLTVCAVYPGDDDECGGGGRGGGARHGGGRDVKVRVDFVVRVPAGVTFEATTVSGDVSARDLRGDVRVAAVSGGVDVATSSGSVEATSVSGAVRVAMGAPREGAPVKATAVSGSVEIKVPASSNFDAEASTVSGRIETDFALPVQRNVVGQNLKGRVGRGGPRLELQTVSGGIRLSRG